MTETKVRVRSTLGVTDHNLLDNRFTNDQHTINSISGLEDALDSKQKKLIPGENIELTPEGEISATMPDVSFANITGEVSDNEQLTTALNEKADVDDIPANTSDLNNDSDFITHTDIEGKQDVINDLGAIRNGASLGATALQSINSTDVISALGYTPYDSTNPSNYATESAVAAKQDALNSTQMNAVNSGATTVNIGQIATNTSAISGIEAKIPAQASDQNQLADKDFVNSSIATNTARFRGTYTSVADLEAYAGDKDNNDYAFVTGEDSLGNTYYDNYVYNGTAWVYRYRLNNSSFTSAQWDAINSGATSVNIGQIATNTTAIAGKQDTISDLATIRSGAALGATALQSITSGNVTTALGYTPYDSANPSGYITSSALSPYAQSANLATVATSGSYNDLSNKPTIPAAQVNADWNASSGVAEILNKPTIPTVNNATITLTQGGTTKGTFTLNQSNNGTIDFDMGGSSVEPDESSINFNSASKLQSVGFINARTGSAMRIWNGTENQYNTGGGSQTWYNWEHTSGGGSWTSETSGISDSLYDVAYGDNKFIAVGSKGTILSSSDGSSWTSETSGVSGYLNGVAYGDNKFIAVGDNGTILSSSDGSSWTSKTSGITTELYGVAYGDNKFIAVGRNGTILSSSDGSSWTSKTSSASSYLNGVAYGDNKFIAAGSNGTILSSSDGSSWTRETSGITTELYDVAYGDNKFIAVGSKGAILSYSAGVSLSCYTLESEPTTASTVYSEPSVTSALTITAVGTGTITLSDTNTYNYNESGNQTTTQSVGEAHPDYLCNIYGVGLKIGTTDVANLASYTAGTNIAINNSVISATDTTYSAFGGATSSVAGSTGLVPAPTTGDREKYLKGDGTWATVSGLQNVATKSSSLSIAEAITGTGSVNFGTMYNPSSSNRYDSTVSIGIGTYTGGISDIVIGNSARAYGTYSTAIGFSAYTRQNYSIQLGYGENNEAKSFYVGFYDTNSSLRNNYKLLDGTTGKIPNDRINVDANPTQNSTNFVTSGTIYSVLGNINTLLSQI